MPSRGHWIRRRETASSDAFTLIEVLVAVVVLSVGIVAVLQAFQNAVAALDASRERFTADRIIEDRIGDVREEAAASGGIRTGTRSGRSEEPGGRYAWTATVRLIKELPEIRIGERVVRESLYEAAVSVRRNASVREYEGATYLRSKE
jgi:type II secretion system protein I